MKILQKRSRKTVVTFEHVYEWRDTPGAGYGFDCTEDGQLLKAYPESLAVCQAGVADGTIVDRGVQRRTSSYVVPAIGQCSCGREVMLEGFTNPCGCGRDYNWAGQQLAPRSQWGEETGETAADILAAEARGFPEDPDD